MADFDAIVVGSGCAGAVAAYELAKAGKSTLVVERGNFARTLYRTEGFAVTQPGHGRDTMVKRLR